jgi:hypothetical protein
MIISEQELTYPILCISHTQNILYFSRTPSKLINCNTLGLKSGFYTNLEIVDSLSNRYSVLTANKTNNVGRFWGFNLFLEQRIQVTLTLEKLPNQPFETFTENLLRLIKGMESYGASPRAKKIVKRSTDYQSLIEDLTEDYYK